MNSDFEKRKGGLRIGPKEKKKGEGIGSSLTWALGTGEPLRYSCPFMASLAHIAAQVPPTLLNSHIFTLVSNSLLFLPLFRCVTVSRCSVFCLIS